MQPTSTSTYVEKLRPDDACRRRTHTIRRSHIRSIRSVIWRSGRRKATAGRSRHALGFAFWSVVAHHGGAVAPRDMTNRSPNSRCRPTGKFPIIGPGAAFSTTPRSSTNSTAKCPEPCDVDRRMPCWMSLPSENRRMSTRSWTMSRSGPPRFWPKWGWKCKRH